MQRLFRISIAAQLMLAIYLQGIEWVNLYPWNDVRRGNGQEGLDVALAFLTAACIVSTWKAWRPGIVFAILLYAVWLGLQIMTFWIPYVGGASEHWRRIWELNFAQTIQWLPRWGNHLPPDASHFVLQLLILAALVSTVAFWVAPRKERRR